jgi:hypothetical protein
MTDAAEHILLTLPRGDRGEVRVSRCRYEAKTFTKLQLWYPLEGGGLAPGRQVITIRDHELPDVIAALSRVARKVSADAQPQKRQAQPAAQVEPFDMAAEDAQGLF